MSKLIDYINNNLDIREEYQISLGKELPESKFFCPFHDNHNTPSAKRYGNGIKCFGKCQRYYTVYDFLKRFNPERINEIKSTIIFTDESRSQTHVYNIIKLDRTKPILELVEEIISCQSIA